MVSAWFLLCRVFSYWTILKKMLWECRRHLSSSHSGPTLSLCQALQVLTRLSLKMNPFPLGAHSHPCWSPCKDACGLLHWLTNPDGTSSQISSPAPLAKVRRDLNLSSFEFKAGHFPGQVSWNQVSSCSKLLCSSFHPCSQEGGETPSSEWDGGISDLSPSPTLILLLGSRHLQKHISHESILQERQKGNWASPESAPG